MDETDCVVDCAQRMVAFYAHESCGKCTPCREGSWWATRVLERIEDGHGREADLPVMKDMTQSIKLSEASRLVEREMQDARLRAVNSNRVIRVRMNCPTVGYIRSVEVIGTGADTAPNRCMTGP